MIHFKKIQHSVWNKETHAKILIDAEMTFNKIQHVFTN
jgi:hypothetical protein